MNTVLWGSEQYSNWHGHANKTSSNRSYFLKKKEKRKILGLLQYVETYLEIIGCFLCKLNHQEAIDKSSTMKRNRTCYYRSKKINYLVWSHWSLEVFLTISINQNYISKGIRKQGEMMITWCLNDIDMCLLTVINSMSN